MAEHHAGFRKLCRTDPGFYNVQIRDAAQTACVVILNGSLQLTQPAALNAIVNSTAVTCNALNNGTKLSSVQQVAMALMSTR